MTSSLFLSLLLAGDGSITIVGQKDRRNRTSGSVHQVDEEELERFEEDDVHQVLAKVPGVYARDEEGFGLRPNIGLRGASAERSAKVTLMEDGILIAPAPYAAPAAYFFPLTTRMTQVEVFKGPSAVGYGPQTIGGAVNMISRPRPREGSLARLDLGYGSFNASKGHLALGHRVGSFSALLEGIHLRADGFKTFSDGSPAGGFEKNEWLVKLGWGDPPKPGLRQDLELRLGFADESSGSSYLGVHIDDVVTAPYQRYDASKLDQMRWEHLRGSLRHRLRFGPGKFIESTLYHHRFHRDWFKVAHFRGGPSLRDLMQSPDRGEAAVYLALLRGQESGTIRQEELMLGGNDRYFYSQGLQTDLAWRWRSKDWKLALRSGLRLHNDQVERDQREDPYQLVEGQLVRTDGAQIIGSANLAWARALALHSTFEFAWKKRLWLTPGLRFEAIRNGFTDRVRGERKDELTQWIPLPGIGAFWRPSEAPFGLLAGLYRGFSPVGPGQNPDVEPESATNYEAGARWFHDRYHVEMIGFLNDYSNLTARCTQSQGCGTAQLNQQFNGGAVRIHGLELMTKLKQELGAGVIAEIAGNLTWTRTAFQTEFNSSFGPFGQVEVGDELPYVPRLQGSVNLSLLRAPFGINWQSKGRSEQRDSAGQGELIDRDRIDGHLIHDLSLTYDVTKRFRLYGTAYNLTDRVYVSSLRPYGPRPGAPRRLMGGLKLTY
ncbi:MAG: hypothetical protein CMH55_07840 [Myxococcales bacterium]|nr:hypothetical protein [Myxococcales bacterium]